MELQLRRPSLFPPDVARTRRRWRVWQRYMDPERFVFLDETGATPNMTCRYGWGPRSDRLVDATPWGALEPPPSSPAHASGIVEPWVIGGAMDGPAFRTYVEQVLVPELGKGDVVAMDNLPAHMVAGVQEALRAAGARNSTSHPYSPDLNPIEQVFAKIKALRRKVGARTKAALSDTIGAALHAFSPDECQSHLTNSGCEFD